MAQSIKISDDEMVYIRQEASISRRSVAGQVEHWLRIGRAIESSTNFSYQHIKDALTGLLNVDELSAEEQEVFFDEFSELMWDKETAEQQAFFADRKNKGLGVGLNKNNKLVYQAPNSEAGDG
jgi:hypothetical protein